MIKNEPNWKRESERVVYMESVLHADEGQGEVKQHVSIDEPVRVRTANLTRSLSRIRVRTIVEEDKSVRSQNNNQFEVYSKKMKTVQEKVDGDNSSPSTYNDEDETDEEADSWDNELNGKKEPLDFDSPSKDPDRNTDCCDNWDDNKRWTKNIIDKLKDSEVVQYVLIVGIGILAAIAFGRTF